jgi:hypothetical protein
MAMVMRSGEVYVEYLTRGPSGIVEPEPLPVMAST